MGLDLECWNNLRDTRVISLLSQLIILTFLFSLYMANRKRGDEKNLQNFLLPFPILLLLLLRLVPWVLHLFLMFSLSDCWWELVLSLEMLYYHEFMFICWGISRGKNCFLGCMTELRSAENRTPRTCMSSEFSGFYTDVFAILWYF